MKSSAFEIFGTRRRTQVVELLALLEESHARELATLMGVPVRTVQRVVEKLEEEGLVVGRVVGRERRLELNRRHFAYAELRALALKFAVRDEEVDEAAGRLRRRPRAPGKEI